MPLAERDLHAFIMLRGHEIPKHTTIIISIRLAKVFIV